ncbi:hypothetical protein VN0452_08170 [Helicobacter pylori]|nr:hypothetical protein VN0452_08170 [Helicobacter pylori]
MFKNALNIHNFSFKNHTSTAIIGTNGAGKSTLINTILGIRSDYNFKAQNNNIPYHDNVIPQRKQLGVVSNLFNYPPGLNANDLFKFYQFFHKNCTPNLFEKNLLNKTYEHLSDGQKQRLKIDLALSHHPQLIIMDEPETSLEQNALIRLSNLISLRNTQQLTSIIATHDPIVLDSCEWVLLLKNGNIAQYKPLNSILKSVAKTFNFKEKLSAKDLLALLKDNSIIGLMGLLIISSVIFGLTQAIASSRSHNVFLFYALSPATFKQITLVLIASRLIVVILYAFVFICTSFYAFNIIALLNFKTLIFGFISIFSSSLFCFCLAIFVAKIFQNEQSILGFANIINLYAVMSCNVFVSLDYLPSIGQLFIKTSVFYQLNQLLLKSFQGIDPILTLITSTLFIVCGITLFLLSTNRMLLIERMR